MTVAELRALALALPDATEQPHFVRASFRVGKRIFATLHEADAQAVVFVHPREKLYGLLKAQPNVFEAMGGWTPLHGALGVRLAVADRELVRELLIASWRRVAPKRLAAQLDGAAPSPPAKRSPAKKPKTARAKSSAPARTQAKPKESAQRAKKRGARRR